jgi:phage shock protein E
MSFLDRFRPAGRSPVRETAQDAVDLEPGEFVRAGHPGAPLLDVRTPAEFQQAHLAGSTNVDILDDRFLARIDAMALDRDAPVYLYCRTGNRSGHAARLLRTRGYRRAFNVGGLDDLVREGADTAS